MAVVDEYGCCHSVDQLVVADASIMPFVPRANTNLTCIMIGEMVGEWLRTLRRPIRSVVSPGSTRRRPIATFERAPPLVLHRGTGKI